MLKIKQDMSGKNFDIFISYRRSDGDAIARILNAEFALRNFRCFLDFDNQLLSPIWNYTPDLHPLTN